MAVPYFRLKRNGTVIATWQPPYGHPPTSGGAALPFQPGGTAQRSILDIPGGPATYTLELLRNGIGGGVSGEIRHRSLLVQGVKR